MKQKRNHDLDEKKIYHYAYDISYPRRNGSKGNIRVREDIKKILCKAGYERDNINEDQFNWNESLRKYYFGILGSSLLIALLVLDILVVMNMTISLDRLFYIFPSLIIFLLMSYTYSRSHLISYKSYVNREKKFPNKLKSGENIFVKLSSNNSSKKLIIIGAHYDSINLRFGDKLNVILYLGKFLGIFLVATTGIAFPIILFFIRISFVEFLLDLFFWIFVFFTTLTQIIWKFNTLHNESEGAIDNATGVAVVLAAAEYFKKNPLKNMDLIFVMFDVEEEGLFGSFDFSERHLEEFQSYGIENVKMICLDGPGSKGKLGFSGSFGFPLVTHTSRDLINELDSTAKNLGHSTIKLWMPYGGSDHVPFGMKGIDSCHVFTTSIVSNTRADKRELINSENLVKTTDVVLTYLEQLDEKL
ncbi:MAG: M28 family metallopeptidase [Candidatus Helarchaeota archaeon]